MIEKEAMNSVISAARARAENAVRSAAEDKLEYMLTDGALCELYEKVIPRFERESGVAIIGGRWHRWTFYNVADTAQNREILAELGEVEVEDWNHFGRVFLATQSLGEQAVPAGAFKAGEAAMHRIRTPDQERAHTMYWDARRYISGPGRDFELARKAAQDFVEAAKAMEA